MARSIPRNITLRRLNQMIDMPDHVLCREDHRTGPTYTEWPCGRNEIGPDGDVVQCSALGEWARKPSHRPGRRGCTRHVAAEIRAELTRYRRAILRGLINL